MRCKFKHDEVSEGPAYHNEGKKLEWDEECALYCAICKTSPYEDKLYQNILEKACVKTDTHYLIIPSSHKECRELYNLTPWIYK